MGYKAALRAIRSPFLLFLLFIAPVAFSLFLLTFLPAFSDMASTTLFLLSLMPCVILAAPVAENSSLPNAQSYNGEAVFVYPSQSGTPSSAAAADTDESLPDLRPLVMAYYPDWTSSQFPPEKIDFDHYDWLDFAFALPDEHFNLTWDDPQTAPALLSRLVDAGHAGGTKVKLSIGGWTGSK